MDTKLLVICDHPCHRIFYEITSREWEQLVRIFKRVDALIHLIDEPCSVYKVYCNCERDSIELDLHISDLRIVRSDLYFTEKNLLTDMQIHLRRLDVYLLKQYVLKFEAFCEARYIMLQPEVLAALLLDYLLSDVINIIWTYFEWCDKWEEKDETRTSDSPALRECALRATSCGKAAHHLSQEEGQDEICKIP